MDDADRAQAHEEMDRAIALRNSLAGEASGETQIVTADGVVCCDCGEPIGGERLRAVPKTVRCVGCQEAREAEENRYA